MSKNRPPFLCTSCAATLPKWQGQCPQCEEWGTVAEAPAAGARGGGRGILATARPAVPITEVGAVEGERRSTGFSEVDRVLGGGLVEGSAVVVGGEPGIGKSTLMTMIAHRMAAAGAKALYVTGEESAAQVRLRAERLGALHDGLLLAAETDQAAIAAHIDSERPAICILDSIQTVHDPDLGGGAGTVTQVREAANRLVALGKQVGTALFLVGHVTKEGSLAGPRTLEHLVDVVLSFDGDRHHAFRLLRGLKNRFGPAGEAAVFEMGAEGLAEITNPSVLFLRGRGADAPGSVVTPAVVGTRTFLVEVQALTVPTQGSPRRVLAGLDPRRAQLVLAILERHGGLHLAGLDVFANVVGGLQAEEPAVDLAAALAIASAFTERPVPGDLVAAGELGLMGETRAVPRLATRLQEAARLGFKRAVVPADAAGPGRMPAVDGLELLPAANLAEALEAADVVA